MADPLLDDLNDRQRDAVLHEGGPLLVVAGAGSGKTRVLTRRIAHVVRDRKVPPYQIMAITFTNKAAAEMRERVVELVGSRAAAMQVSTFHSACVRILRREAHHLDFLSGFSIYDSADSQRLITTISRDLEIDSKRHSARSLASAISNQKNELIDAESFAAIAQGLTTGLCPRSTCSTSDSSRSRERLTSTTSLAHGGAVPGFPQVAEEYHDRFRHVLVDEYQDTNHAQYVLVRELVGGTSSPDMAELSVVGDADQSIYAFRGATIRNIDDFETDYPDAVVVMLEQNYRSTQNILSAANAVIARNKDRREKHLWTASGSGEKIIGYVADDENDEAAFGQ